MCVIVHKERGKKIPSSETLSDCFSSNSHGAGILLQRKDSKILEIHKGLMTFKDFEKQLKELNITDDDEVALHFRITTSGGTCPENCHPFPISGKVDELKAVRLNTERAFIHNGVLGSGDETLKISDTQVFVRDIMNQNEISDNLEDEAVQKYISELAGSSNRFIVADAKKGIFQRFGIWKEDGGIYYSNLNFKYKYSYSGNYGTGTGSNFYGTGSRTHTTREQFIPDLYTIICPICGDHEIPMKNMLAGTDIYCCPTCGILYDDKTYKIYDKKSGCWISLIDVNNFLSDDELKKLTA